MCVNDQNGTKVFKCEHNYVIIFIIFDRLHRFSDLPFDHYPML
jgi:hypothetical protein